jgi:DnaJ like chaperone protein
MSLWERLSGAVAGLGSDAHMTSGGPIGVLLAGLAVLGRQGANDGILDCEEYGALFTPQRQVAFAVGVIALSAKMAKADGVVTRDEVEAFKQVFKVPQGEMRSVSRIFNTAKQDVVGYEAYAEQLASLLGENRRLLQDILEGLFHIALANGVLDPNEERFLAHVARLFGFTDAEFGTMKARHASLGKHDPYEVLGIPPEIGDNALEMHYRKLVTDYQPDKMIARGVPPEFAALATEKIAVINAAYEAAVKQRGSSRPSDSP